MSDEVSFGRGDVSDRLQLPPVVQLEQVPGGLQNLAHIGV